MRNRFKYHFNEIQKSIKSELDRLEKLPEDQMAVVLLHIFVKDLLGIHTPAAHIYSKKAAEDLSSSFVTNTLMKMLAAVSLTIINLGTIFFVLSTSNIRGLDWQRDFAIACFLQFVIEVLFVEVIIFLCSVIDSVVFLIYCFLRLLHVRRLNVFGSMLWYLGW